MGKKRQALATSYHTSPKTGFFDCCYSVFLDSAPLSSQPFCSPQVSQYKLNNILSLFLRTQTEIPRRNSDSRRIESKNLPTKLNYRLVSQSYDSQFVSLVLNSFRCPGISCSIHFYVPTDSILWVGVRDFLV